MFSVPEELLVFADEKYSKEFQQKMSYWTRNTPLAAIRPEVDRQDLVENAELAGGRPVSQVIFD